MGSRMAGEGQDQGSPRRGLHVGHTRLTGEEAVLQAYLAIVANADAAANAYPLNVADVENSSPDQAARLGGGGRVVHAARVVPVIAVHPL